MGKSLLIIVSGLLLVFGIHQISVNNQQKAMAVRNINYAKNQQAKDIASSMVAMAISQLNSDITWRTGLNYQNFLGGSGSLNIEDNSTNSSLGPFDILLKANGIYDGTSSNIQVLMRRTSYSKFAYFTNVEPTIYFVTGDTIKGPLHTNGTLHISGNPVFEGEVTSPNNWSGTGNPKFLKGYDFNAPAISLPTSLTDLANTASSGGLQFTAPSQIIFNSDGTIDVSQQVKTRTWYGTYVYSWGPPQTYNLSNYNGIISSTKDIYVKGDVNGQVTVHSSSDIHITGDLTYADNPVTNPNSTDLLGLISDNNVIVDDGAETDHGTSDVTIDATIMALNSFTVQDYQSGSSRGQLNIFGGVVQNTRGAVGTFSSYYGTTYTASGYSKLYQYDDRLMSRWPPGYPLIDSYSIVTWKE